MSDREIDAIRKEIERLQKLTVDLENKKLTPDYHPRREIYKKYFFIDRLIGVEIAKDEYESIDDTRYNNLNYFHTEDEANKYKNFFLSSLDVFRLRDEIRNGWEPDWDNEEKKFCVEFQTIEFQTNDYGLELYSCIYMNIPKIFAFETDDQAELFIKTVNRKHLHNILLF